MNHPYRDSDYDEDYLTEFIQEYCDEDTRMLMDETIPYDLIHSLLKDRAQLRKALIDTRGEVNALTEDKTHLPYPTTAQDMPGYYYDDHPAMKRYQELYCEFAVDMHLF
jgi:hypothetical protein